LARTSVLLRKDGRTGLLHKFGCTNLGEGPGMKTILLHVHDDAEQDSRISVAIDLARAGGGHVVCVQAAQIEALAADPYGGMFGLSTVIDAVHGHERQVRTAIEARLRDAGISWEWRHFDGGVIETLIAESRLVDLTIVSQPAPRGRREQPSLVGDIVLHCRTPVLMVPGGWQGFDCRACAVIAWNGSAEAAQALRLALPMLIDAGEVHVVEVCEDSAGLSSGTAVAWLGRHGVAAEQHEWPAKGRRVSVALLHAAAELDAGWLVMGAYGHSRLRETVLGGVTRELIGVATLPVLMAH
jgi:nucleotide-binding universal stress UspA family protein